MYKHPEHSTFGSDKFGLLAERFARFFGTPKFIIGQTILVVLWIGLNGFALANSWDPYPFILLNLAFSTQAAYAAPLILLAQTRQSIRDEVHAKASAEHRDELATLQNQMLKENTDITKQIHELSVYIKEHYGSKHKGTE